MVGGRVAKILVLYWAVLSDEQMSNGYPFSLLNDEQMSNWVGVKHLPENDEIPTSLYQQKRFGGSTASVWVTCFRPWHSSESKKSKARNHKMC